MGQGSLRAGCWVLHCNVEEANGVAGLTLWFGGAVPRPTPRRGFWPYLPGAGKAPGFIMP